MGLRRLLDGPRAAGGRLYFPTGRYLTAPLVLRKPGVGIELGPGALLQHPPPSDPTALASSAQGDARGGSPPPPPPAGRCSDAAFLTVAAPHTYLGGRGGTFDTNGFAGHSLCIADAANVTVESALFRGSASWSTHIFRSRAVTVRGVKLFSGADGFDPDNSQQVLL